MIYDDAIKNHILAEALGVMAKYVQYSIGDNKIAPELIEGDIFFEVSGSRITRKTPKKYKRQRDVYRYRCNIFWDTQDVISPVNLSAWPMYSDAETGDFKEDQCDEREIIFNNDGLEGNQDYG